MMYWTCLSVRTNDRIVHASDGAIGFEGRRFWYFRALAGFVLFQALAVLFGLAESLSQRASHFGVPADFRVCDGLALAHIDLAE